MAGRLPRLVSYVVGKGPKTGGSPRERRFPSQEWLLGQSPAHRVLPSAYQPLPLGPSHARLEAARLREGVGKAIEPGPDARRETGVKGRAQRRGLQVPG